MKNHASNSNGLMPVMKNILHIRLCGDKEKVAMVGGDRRKCKFKEAEKNEMIMHLIFWGPK